MPSVPDTADYPQAASHQRDVALGGSTATSLSSEASAAMTRWLSVPEWAADEFLDLPVSIANVNAPLHWSFHGFAEDTLRASPLPADCVFPELGVIPGLECHEFTLSCGMHVLLVLEPETPLVTGALIFPGGTLSSPAYQVCLDKLVRLSLSQFKVFHALLRVFSKL
jgi:hypothetical protein